MNDVIPIAVPSYTRYSNSRTLNLFRKYSVCDDVYVFVRKEELDSYKKSYPEFNYIALVNVDGLGTTRQIIADFFMDGGFRQYIDIDDDITSITYNQNNNGKNQIRNVKVALEIFKNITRHFFDVYKDLVVIGACKQHFINNKKGTLYYNKGATPRQLLTYDVRKLAQNNIRRNKAGNLTGDDIDTVAQIMMKQLDLGTTPVICYSCFDDKKDSTIRTSDNHRILHLFEDSMLESYGIRDLFRKTTPKKSDDPVFFNIDFKKYSKKFGRRSFIQDK